MPPLGADHQLRVHPESNLKSGSQHVVEGQPLVYGKSITDGCLSWEETVPLLKNLASAVQKRRLVVKNEAGADE